MRAELADGNSGAPQHGSGTSALADSRSIAELQSHRAANARVIGVPEAVGTVDRVRTAGHEIVNLDGIPLHRIGMGNCDECMKAIEHLRSDRVIHETLTVFGDGVSKIRAHGEEKTDRIRRTRRHDDAFSGFTRFLS